MRVARRAPDDDRRLMGDLLIEAGIVSRAGISAGLHEQRLRGGRLGFNLVRIGEVTPVAFHFFLQERFPILVPELAEAMRHSPAIDLVPAGLAHHYSMFPVRAVDGVLDLAVAGADTPLLIPALQELTGLRVEPLISPPSLIAEALARFYPGEVAPGVLYRPLGENLLVLSDPGRGIRPLDPDLLPEDASGAEWLRGIIAQGIDRRARRIQIEPQSEALQIWFQGPRESDSGMSLPGGAYAGIASLLEGLSGIAARPRSAPRDGRLTLSLDGRRVSASVLASQGYEGHSYAIDLRQEMIISPDRDVLAEDVPLLADALRSLAESRRGLLVLAAPGPAEIETGVTAILNLLGNSLPGRVSVADWNIDIARSVPHDGGEHVPLATRVDRALERQPDLIVTPEMGRADDPRSAIALARERVVIAPLVATDAFDAAEQIGSAGMGRAAADVVAGILGVGLLETLCASCRVPYDLFEVVPPRAGYRSIPTGEFAAGAGCAACRGSGARNLVPVFEFLPTSAGDALFRPGCRAALLRDDRLRAGESTLLKSALQKASTGLVDVREPLRLLLHERL